MRHRLLILLLPIIVSASIIKDFTMITPNNSVSEGGVATVIATLKTSKKVKVAMPSFPQSDEYKVLGSSSRISSSSSIQIINGKRISDRTVEYVYYYKIQFLKKGEVKLPALTVDVNGEMIST